MIEIPSISKIKQAYDVHISIDKYRHICNIRRTFVGN